MKFAAFFGLSLFAFVFFTVASSEPARPAPQPVTPAAAAPQDEPDPAGIPKPAPPPTTKSKKPKYKMYSRAYVPSREEREEPETVERP